jgi:hypothetical protein
MEDTRTGLWMSLYDFLAEISSSRWDELDVYQFLRALDPVVDGLFIPVGYPLRWDNLSPDLIDAGFALDLDYDDSRYLHLYWTPWPEQRTTHDLMEQQWYYVGKIRQTKSGISIRQNAACPLQAILIRKFLSLCDASFKTGLFPAVYGAGVKS